MNIPAQPRDNPRQRELFAAVAMWRRISRRAFALWEIHIYVYKTVLEFLCEYISLYYNFWIIHEFIPRVALQAFGFFANWLLLSSKENNLILARAVSAFADEPRARISLFNCRGIQFPCAAPRYSFIVSRKIRYCFFSAASAIICIA